MADVDNCLIVRIDTIHLLNRLNGGNAGTILIAFRHYDRLMGHVRLFQYWAGRILRGLIGFVLNVNRYFVDFIY